MKTTLVVTVEWQASHHFARAMSKGHKCARLHGHNYKLEVFVSGPVNSAGIIVDTASLKYTVKRRVYDRFDHRHLNDDPWFATTDPTVEYLGGQIMLDLQEHLPGVEKIVLWETETGRVEITG